MNEYMSMVVICFLICLNNNAFNLMLKEENFCKSDGDIDSCMIIFKHCLPGLYSSI